MFIEIAFNIILSILALFVIYLWYLAIRYDYKGY